ncbi:MAG: hypothetical protein ACRD4Y_18460, partial [Candidatus Acidiferrales bacterium]
LHTDTEQALTIEKWLGELSGEQLPEAQFTFSKNRRHTDGSASANEELSVLAEIVIELRNQGLLSGEKSESMLRKLSGAGRPKLN